MNKKSQYWLDIAEYDLLTAHAMLETKRYLYVGFMCHQTIEKILKSYWQSIKNEIPPKTHNLNYLASETGLLEQLHEEHLDFLDELDPLNIETRYPEHKQRVLQKLDKKYSTHIYTKTKELYQWIKEKLSTM